LEAKRVGEAEAIRKIDEELDAKVAQVRGKTITLRLKATEKGGLFKAVAAKDVAKHIASDLGINIPEENITLATAVKTVGEHVAQVHSKNQKGDVAVVVEAEA
jgi:ribosomal protein L9